MYDGDYKFDIVRKIMDGLAFLLVSFVVLVLIGLMIFPVIRFFAHISK